jgi:DNA-binding response OmpR family regulator
MPRGATPDVVILDSQWPRRALLRAQLIEEGYDVVAADDWATVKSYVRVPLKPRLVIVDLQGLANATEVLNELRHMMKPERVLVFTALGTLPAAEMQRWGFHTIARPVTIGNIVDKATALVRAGSRRDS